MRTISKTQFNRYMLEAEEAELLNKETIASNLTKQLVKRADALRDDDDSYLYDSESFESDVQESIWDIIVRVGDFFGTQIPAEKANEIASFYAEKIVDDIKKEAGINAHVGLHEPSLPGEHRETTTLEIEE